MKKSWRTGPISSLIALLCLSGSMVGEPEKTLPLSAAVRAGDPAELSRLIGSGAALDTAGPEGLTALHVAAQSGRFDLARILVEAGARVNVLDAGGSTPLHLAAEAGFLEIVQLLHQNGANLDTAGEGGLTALMWAAYRDRVDILKYLIRNDAALNTEDEAGRTALDFAAYMQNNESTRLLRLLGAAHGPAENKDSIAKLKGPGERRIEAVAEAVAAKFTATYQKGAELHGSGKFREAIALLEPLQSRFEEECQSCYGLLAQSYLGIGDYENAKKATATFMVVNDDDVQTSRLYLEMGRAFRNKKPLTIEDLYTAHRYLEEALSLDLEEVNETRYYLARYHASMGRRDEALENYRAFLEKHGQSPLAELADKEKTELENAFRPRYEILPIVSLDGEVLDLKPYRGKLVLLDFWATWCAPCKASLPAMKRFARRMKKDPLVVIGISGDETAEIARAYVEKAKMDWPQYIDPHIAASGELFKVGSYPTYILLNPEGEVDFVTTGWSYDQEQNIAVAIKRQLKKLRRESEEGG